MEIIIKKLPLPIYRYRKKNLKKAILANLNEIARTIPNQNIIINSLVLQEARVRGINYSRLTIYNKRVLNKLV